MREDSDVTTVGAAVYAVAWVIGLLMARAKNVARTLEASVRMG